jgi:hypothetical protein
MDSERVENMNSKVVSLDHQLDKKVKKEVGEEVGEQIERIRDELGLNQDEPEDGDSFSVTPNTPSTQKVKPVFSSFPSSEGWFGKIWKVLPDGNWEPKEYVITAPETVPDLEQEIVRLVHEKNWGEGKYQVQVRNRDKRQGFRLNQQVIVGSYTDEEKNERSKGRNTSESPWIDPVEAGMKMTNKILEVSRQMTPSSQVDLTRVAQIQADTFKAGVDVAREAARGSSSGDSTPQLLQIITIMKDILKPVDQPKQPTITETLSILKDLNVISTKSRDDETDMLGKLKLLKDGLGLKYAHEVEGVKNDPMKMIENVGTLITALRPLINPDSGPRSILEMVVEAFGKYGAPLFDAVRDFAQAKRMEVEHRMNQGAYGNGAPPPALTTRRPIPQPSTQPIKEDQSRMNLISQIAEIVKSKDESKFQFLRETIFGFLGPQWIVGLVSGDVSVEYIISISKMQFGNTFDNEESKLYLYKFVAWLRDKSKVTESSTPSSSVQANPVPGNGLVIARCSNCRQEWDVPKQDWDSEGGRQCECGGALVEVSPSLQS